MAEGGSKSGDGPGTEAPHALPALFDAARSVPHPWQVPLPGLA